MEMDELKNSWLALNEKLEKQEMLKETVIKKVLQEKTSKSLNKLVNIELIGIAILLLILPVIVYAIEKNKISEFYTFFMYSVFLFWILTLVWVIIKLWVLTRVDLNKDIKHNMLYTNKYNLYIRREKLAMYFVIPALFIPSIIIYASVNAFIYMWVFLACLLVLSITGVIWQYKKIYDKNINFILKSLDELKELEDEND